MAENNCTDNPQIAQQQINKNRIRKESNVFNDIIVEHQKRDGRFKDNLPVPIWGGTERGIPNGLLRSALFGMIESGKRAHVNNVPLFTSRTSVLRFSGDELDQRDCDVFMALLNLVQEQGSYRAKCSFYGLRKMLSMAKGKRNTEIL